MKNRLNWIFDIINKTKSARNHGINADSKHTHTKTRETLMKIHDDDERNGGEKQFCFIRFVLSQRQLYQFEGTKLERIL